MTFERRRYSHMQPLISKFKALGEKETRAIQILGPGGEDLPPPDKYAFVEQYCEEMGFHG
jgi:hypothetical protein